MNIQVCRDTSDAVALYLPQRLFLKPFAKLNISVQLPSLKVHGKSISNWELMEKLRKMVQPESFSVLKVSKNSLDVIRFDAELENKDRLDKALSRLDDRTVKLTGYPEELKVRASEAKSDFPSRHSWDSFFRDAADMDEMKPGERPDTIHIMNLPIRWFVSLHERDEDAPPSENIFRKVLEKFGKVRCVDVPAADPFRGEMKLPMRGVHTPATDSAMYFEGYVQYTEYVGFVRAMDALRGHKLLRRREDGSAEWVGLVVDFDKSKHMTDAAVKRRGIVRERLVARQRTRHQQEKEEKDQLSKKEEKERQKIEKTEREKLEKMHEREERRKKKQLAKLIAKDKVDVHGKVAEEERKLTKAQRKLQAVRLIEELFRRIELRPRSSIPQSEHGHSSRHERYFKNTQDAVIRERIVAKFKEEQEIQVQIQRDRLKQAVDGRIVIRSALETKKPKPRTSSISSASSEGAELPARHKKIKTERLTTPEREQEFNRAAGMYAGMPLPYGYPYHQFPAPSFPYPPHQTNMYYPVRNAYYPPPHEPSYTPRARFPTRRARGRPFYRGGPRIPFFEGPNASHEYFKYFKRLTEAENANEHDNRGRSRSRSRSRSRRRSYSSSRSRSRSRHRHRSRSRRRSYTRSRSRSSRRSRSRRSHSSSRRSRSRSNRRSRTPKRTTQSKEADRTKTPDKKGAEFVSPGTKRKERSKSWSLPKEGQKRKSWSKSPSKQ